MNKLSTERRTAILAALIEGNSIRATCRMTGAAKGTVLRLLGDVGLACHVFHHETVRNVPAKKIQCDEIWAYVGMKQKNVPEENENHPGLGSVYTFTALDPDTKLIISWDIGKRDAYTAYRFMLDLAERLANRVHLTTDGFRPYVEAVWNAFGNDVDYAMLQKLYAASPEPDSRYSPAQVTGITMRGISGYPVPSDISTSHVERNNLTMRMQMRRFTRLTNGFSKKIMNLRHAVALHFVHYNFCRPHQTLTREANGTPTTPGMAAGLTDRVWTIEDIVGLLPN